MIYDDMERLITIVGPTAVGKTDVTLYLANILKSTVISGDAFQVYRHMNIGTAKPSLSEMETIKHHLIDILEPHGSYSVADFKHEAEKIISSENKAKHTPILSGGTGLYVQALLEGYQFTDTEPDPILRNTLDTLWIEKGLHGLQKYGEELAHKAGIQLHFTDKHRLYRAIELLLKGDALALAQQTKDGLRYDGPVIGLSRPRSELYARINLRVDQMIQHGLFEEVEHLRSLGISIHAQSMKGIGYKEVIPYLEGTVSREECIETIKQNTRRFAKRQITWYKRMPYIQWIYIEKDTSKKEIEEKSLHIIKSHYDSV